MGGAAAVPAARLTRLLTRALEQPDDAVRLLALERTLQLRASATTEELTSLVKAVTTLGLRDPRPELRSNAIRLAQTAGADLLSQVASLLDDPAPEVRRAALLAVGAQRDAIAEDDLLRWLHDPDDQVRQLCEQALRGRGLSDQHLKLGRLLTAPQPATRMLVLEQLRRADDLDPRVWLRRLSHDPDPAVRAAAIRATTELPAVDLHDRVEQIARDDPSPTVRELARFYLRTGTAARQP
jgi:HEAT repeat protein